MSNKLPKSPGPDKDRSSKSKRPHPPHPHGLSGEILFWAYGTDGTEPTAQEDLFAVDPLTASVRRLSDDSSGTPFASDRDPSWSPDRNSLVAMRSEQGGSTRLVQRSAEDGAILADIPIDVSEPVWLDGSWAICSLWEPRQHGGNGTSLVAVTVPGGRMTQISSMAPRESLGAAAWHPAGGLLAELTVSDPATEAESGMVLVHAPAQAVRGVLDGGPPLKNDAFSRLDIPGGAWNPAWAPDGKRIVFSTLRPCTTQENGRALLQPEIALLTLASPTKITLMTDDSHRSFEEGVNDTSPAFSPDGKTLAWSRGYEDNWTQIVTQEIRHPSTRTVLTPDKSWFRSGLDW